MLIKLNIIIIYSLIAFFLSIIIYPCYIVFLQKIKAWKNIREDWLTWWKAEIFKKLHWHKSWTPTMWWWVFLFVMLLLVLFSILLQYLWLINNTLITRQETYIILFWFFSMWILWLIDDYINIIWKGSIKWLTARMKLIWMFLFSWFISYWFTFKLWINYINLWPFDFHLNLGFLYLIFTFFFTVAIVNAINIVDWLDWLAWWLMMIILFIMWIITFFYQWYLATTIIWISLGILLAFLWFNINPAKIFMWDSWALAIWWMLASLVYLLNIKMWIIIPFIVLFSLFWIELWSSFLQIIRKKIFKRKLFPIAPFHHLLEYQGRPEYNIVMKFWLIQWILAWLTLVLVFYQLNLS